MSLDVFLTGLLRISRRKNRRTKQTGRWHSAAETVEPRLLLSADLNPDVDSNMTGSRWNDHFRVGSGSQQVVAGARNDRIISMGDAGEPDPAQTDGDTGRVNPPVEDGTANDIFYGGLGADVFEFRPLINATQEVRDEYTSVSRGYVNWRGVAGENDDVHAHWVEGIGNDTVMDFSRNEGDRFEVNGHTATLRSITYGEDEIGAWSLVTIYSQQGDGGNGGANTAAGAHDEDPLGTFRVYGDRVTEDDIKFNAGVFYGIEQLNEADRLSESNGGGRREVITGADGDVFDGTGRVNDRVTAGRGSQDVNLGGGYDVIYLLGDGGEPDPAQTDGADGRVNPPVDSNLSDDVVRLGQGRDIVEFRPLLNAKPDILAKHTRSNGSVNWRGVAGENNNVHDHWVEGIGNDVLLNYSEADGDQLRVYGHTATLGSIDYGEDALGEFSLVTIYSQQGDGGGAHDEDPLGTFKVYGDKVTADDVRFKANVFYGVDQLDTAEALNNRAGRDAGMFGSPSSAFTEPVRDFTQEATYDGSRYRDHFVIGSGNQTVKAGAGNDVIYSLGDAGEPDPAQTAGANGRINDPVPNGRADDVLIGGLGADTFEFRPLLNATREVQDQFRNSNNGLVNWRRVAGENDNVHDHWVEGIGNDTIVDYNEADGDRIKVSGHTATLGSITYGEDERGAFSLVTIYSQQGDGGAGGASTATGAHDEDPLGTFRVYGDEVTADDITFNAGVFYGMDALDEANNRADDNANGRREYRTAIDDDVYHVTGRVSDYVTLGRGSQNVDTTAGNDTIYVLGDAGEPDPAQTDGADGRVTPPVNADQRDDVIRAGQGRDTLVFRPLLNAKTGVLLKHSRSDGRINWRGVAGENNNVHDHWVEGIGNDTVLDFSKADGDRLKVEGHTATLGSITYGEDAQGDWSLVTIYSQQGDGGGAHDEDPLGTIRIYGDKVTEDDISFKANVFYGIDMLNDIEGISSVSLVEGVQTELLNPDVDSNMTGSRWNDHFRVGSGSQQVVAGARNDRIISMGDAGEPDPAQTDGDTGRVNPPVEDGTANDIFYGGLGADVFEFRPLINATQEVRDEYTSVSRGYVNWRGVAGENDDVHAHWVEGIGNDTVMDFSRNEGDRFEVNGHTATLRSITYGEDEIGAWSLVTIYSQQGDGGNGGANTAAGAHDEDPLGTFRVYGDRVTEDDIKFNAGVFYGIEQLNEADRLSESNGGGRREVIAGADGDVFDGTGRVNDRVTAGRGSQDVNLGGGYDVIYLLGDGGEPDPAQTDGADGRVNPPVDSNLSDDVVRLGQGRDIVEFRPLLNAKPDILAKHTRSNGSVNWRGVAGENNNVHDHWVEGIGNDVLLNYSEADGDQLRVYGHTATLGSIDYGEDALGEFSLVTIYSQQGDGGGAHDEDPLGTFKVYGDKVTADDVRFKANVFYGVDQLDTAEALNNRAGRDAGMFGSPSSAFTEPVRDFTQEATYDGSRYRDHFVIGSGNQTVKAGAGNDVIYSLGDAGEPDPAQTAGANGRINDPVPNGRADDVLIGGLGADTFEFRPLLNATREVQDQFRNSNNGLVNWRRVAGENDNVHDHWVEGIGNDTIVDYNEADGDRIKVSGHTATLGSITYGEDERGAFSLVTIYSQQGDGGAGGASTATGAHDEDPLGTFRVYGDEVTADDITFNAGVFYGMDALDEANNRADDNANGRREYRTAIDDDVYHVTGRVSDYVTLGRGSQNVDTTAGNDTIYVLGDAGEPDPAQTDGADGRVTPPVNADQRDDVIRAGQGRDTLVFRPLLNAKTGVLLKHSRSDGRINWRGVAGENNNVHDHWVEGIGNDTVLDFSKADGDRLKVEGHTATLGSITYGEDAQGDWSLVTIYSQQGDGGGAHDEDPLGTIRIYGDKVTEDDISFKANVFYGIDMLNDIEGISNADYIRLRQSSEQSSSVLLDDDEDDSLFSS